MKFYISSSLKNYKQVQKLSKILQNKGWQQTFDWTAHVFSEIKDIETLKMIGQQDANGVKNADVVIILTPAGKGTHVELGMAIALNKMIYIFCSDKQFFQCDENTSAFYWLANIKHVCGSIEDLAEKLIADNA